jgi:RNA processing factor Prp31
MKRLSLLLWLTAALLSTAHAQQPVQASQPSPSSNPIDLINFQLGKISSSVDRLQGNWKSFFDSFSTNQGLRLSERQQKLLLAFEVLNRAEQRLGNLQKMRLDSTEKLSSMRLQLARINDDLRPESVDKYVSTRGTLDAEQLRELRRQALLRERTELSNIIYQVQTDLDTTNTDIRTTEQFLREIRNRIFPEIQKELADL